LELLKLNGYQSSKEKRKVSENSPIKLVKWLLKDVEQNMWNIKVRTLVGLWGGKEKIKLANNI
jgi:hypothetical protein